MKSRIKIFSMLLLLALVGLHSSNGASIREFGDCQFLDGCSPTSSDIGDIQVALADYENWTLSYVVNHTTSVTATSCDGTTAIGGQITLVISEESNVWNWERDGGDNIIVIWPAA